MIIFTCPECGADLVPYTIATYPPIHAYRCFNCGWVHEEDQGPIIRVPFGTNTNDLELPTINVSNDLELPYLNVCHGDTCAITIDEAKIRLGLEEAW